MSNNSLSFTCDELLASARKMTGIDLYDEDAVAPLTVLLESYSRDSALHAAGAGAMQRYLLRLLSNRLRMQRDFAAHPEIADQVIAAPVFLWGMPRTGSTKMQKLLAASGDFNWLTFWQSHNPSLLSGQPSEPVQARISEADDFVRWFAAASPATQHTHPLQTHEAEEESFLLMQSLRTPCFMAFADVTGYLHWLATQDPGAQFAYLKDTLKYLQWQGLADVKKPWVLKSPLSYGMEKAVLGIFPDAKLVMTHREPSASIPSFCSTISSYYKPFSDADINYATKVGQLVWGLNLHLGFRKDHPAFAILDVVYRDLDRDVDSVMQKVYDFCGMPLRDASACAMRAWNEQHPKDGHGVHRYSLDDFGLTAQDLQTQFTAYIEMLEAL